VRSIKGDSFDGSPPLSRNLSLDLVAAIGVGVSVALVGSLLPTIARRGGLEPLGLAALAAAPFLANLMSVYSGWLGPRSTRQLALFRGLGAGSLLAMLVLPVPAVIIAVTFVFWLSLSLCGPFQIRLLGIMYPARSRGRVVGFLGTGRAAASVLAALAGGLVADRFGGPAAVGWAGIIGAMCALSLSGLRTSAVSVPLAYTARDSIRAVRERPMLRRVALAQGFFFGGLIAAGPLFALVNVDRLDLSLTEVGGIGVVGAVATGLSFLAWGAVADRLGPLAPSSIGSIIGLGGLFAYALAPSVAVVWVAVAAIGTCSAAVEVSVVAVISDGTPLAARAAAMSGWMAITGVRGLAAPFISSTLVQAGVVDVTTALLLCAVVSAFGVVLFWRAASHARAERTKVAVAVTVHPRPGPPGTPVEIVQD
jgi:MFS family permease